MKTKILALFLALALLVSLCACAKGEAAADPTAETQTENGLWTTATYTEDTTLGSGEKEVLVKVIAEGKTVTFTLKTDKENLGDALLESGLAKGEEGQYGLYVKVVNGMTADYDVDQSYWSFSIDGEAQMTGVSDAKIEGGEAFELVYTK